MSDHDEIFRLLVSIRDAFELFESGSLSRSEFVKLKSRLHHRDFWADAEFDDRLMQLVQELLEEGVLRESDVQRMERAITEARSADTSGGTPTEESGSVPAAPANDESTGRTATTDRQPRPIRQPVSEAPSRPSTPPSEPATKVERTKQEPRSDSAPEITPPPRFQRKHVLAMAAGAAATAIFGIAAAFVFGGSEEGAAARVTTRQVEKALGAEPSMSGMRSLLDRPAEFLALARELDSEGAESWKKLLAEQWPDLLAKRDADSFCGDVRTLQNANWIPAVGEPSKRACASLQSAQAALSEHERKTADAWSAYREIEREVDRAEEDVGAARIRLAASQGGLINMHGYLHGEIEPQLYDVSDGSRFGKRYVLRTTDTVYTTKGNIQLWVRFGETRSFVTKGGATVSRDVIVEADTTGMELARLALISARERLSDARRKLNSANRPDDSEGERLQRSIQDAKKAVLLVARGRGALPPLEGIEVVKDPEKLTNLSQVICGNSAETVRGNVQCACPSNSPSRDDVLKVQIAYIGAFTGPEQREVILATEGCGKGFNFRHATALIRLGDDLQWRLVTHDWEVESQACRPAIFGTKAALICETATFGGGSAEIWISIRTATKDGLASQVVAEFYDRSGSCDFNGEFRAQPVEFFADDVDGDGTVEAVVLGEYAIGTYRAGFAPEGDTCDDVSLGKVAITTRRAVFVAELGDKESVEISDTTKLKAPIITDFLAGKGGTLPDVRDEVQGILAFEPGSERAWLVYRRRLAALRNSQEIDKLRRETTRLAQAFPDNSEQLWIEFAETCEDAGDYSCASEVYETLLDKDPSSLARGRAAWFFATAPEPHGRRDVATNILVDAINSDEFNGRAAIAQSEILLQQDKAEQAKQFLESYLREKKSKLVQDQITRIEEDPTPVEAPRDKVAPLLHKIPAEWSEGIPEGPLTPHERMFAVELAAIEARNAGEFRRAEALFRESARRSSNPFVTNTFRLGLGKVFERENDFTRALRFYEDIMVAEAERDPRILNRLAWFLLTVDDDRIQDRNRGLTLAKRAVEATDRAEPAALDTLAEAHRLAGDLDEARALLEQAIELDPKRSYYQTRLDSL